MTLNVGKVSDIASYFVIATGTSTRHVKSLADSVEEMLEGAHPFAHHKEGYAEGLWVLLDCGDVVAHIFQGHIRTFYDLEHLWQDAPRVSFSRQHG